MHWSVDRLYIYISKDKSHNLLHLYTEGTCEEMNDRLPWNTTNRFVFAQRNANFLSPEDRIWSVNFVISIISSQESSQAPLSRLIARANRALQRRVPDPVLRSGFGLRRYCGWCCAASRVLLLWYRSPNPVQVLQDLNNCLLNCLTRWVTAFAMLRRASKPFGAAVRHGMTATRAYLRERAAGHMRSLVASRLFVPVGQTYARKQHIHAAFAHKQRNVMHQSKSAIMQEYWHASIIMTKDHRTSANKNMFQERWANAPFQLEAHRRVFPPGYTNVKGTFANVLQWERSQITPTKMFWKHFQRLENFE